MTTASHFSLLVVDDEPDLRTLYELTLLREGYDIETAGTVEEALLHLKDRTYSAVITDMRLPDGTGLDLLRWLEETGRREKAIVITAYGSAENAVEALKAGAYDYLTKPVDLQAVPRGGGLGAGARRAERADHGPDHAALGERRRPPRRCAQRVRWPRRRHLCSAAHARAWPAAPTAMEQVRALVEKVARSMAPVLVNGESGTGKELVARAIHEVSVRAAQPFIAVNCSAIPEQLLEAEFFGYRKGAFTGADEDREGFFQAANGGTLFLDEIGDLPLSMQSKLLRAIQERSVRPVGAVSRTAGERAAAQRHPQGPGRRGAGRQVPAGPVLPPQRDPDPRAAAARAPRRPGWPSASGCSNASPPMLACRLPPRLTREALAHLARYPFPGNVRELENLLHRAVALSGGETIDVDDLGLPESCSPTKPMRVADAPVPVSTPSATRAEAAAPTSATAPCPPRSRCPPTWQRISTRSNATSSCARSSATASTAPRPARAWGCRCGRCATAWRGSGVNVGGDLLGGDRD